MDLGNSSSYTFILEILLGFGNSGFHGYFGFWILVRFSVDTEFVHLVHASYQCIPRSKIHIIQVLKTDSKIHIIREFDDFPVSYKSWNQLLTLTTLTAPYIFYNFTPRFQVFLTKGLNLSYSLSSFVIAKCLYNHHVSNHIPKSISPYLL